MKIGIVGAGGIGSYYAGLLSRAGHSMHLLARGQHLHAINAHGLEVRTPDETFVSTPSATDNGHDLHDSEFVIVAVKSYSLAEVGPTLVGAAKAGATIVPLLNGIDVAERLEALGVPRLSIVGGLVQASLFRTAPGKVERRSPFDRVVLGELDRMPRVRVQRFVDALACAGVTARVSDDIELDLWRKFALIVAMNVACGLVRGPMGLMLATERGRGIIAGSVAEIVQLSRVVGTALSDDDETLLRAELFALAPSTEPSFLADLERGGPTELELLTGNVSRLGREHGVATPIHDVATAAFEALTQPSRR